MKNYLSYKNDWESDSYFVDGKKVRDIKAIGYDGIRYEVVGKDVSVSYSDHGHTYAAKSRHYFIKVGVLGVNISVDLNEIIPKKRKVVAIDFTLAE